MKSRRKKQSLLTRILNRYKRIPRQLHSRRISERSKAQRLIALTLCVPVLLYCGGYMVWYRHNQNRIEQENAQYRTLYATQEPTALPQAISTPAPTPVPTAFSTDLPTAVPVTAAATAVSTAEPLPTTVFQPTDEPTAVPTAIPTAEPTAIATAEPTAIAAEALDSDAFWQTRPTLAPLPSFEIAADATRSPFATPDANTMVYALETPGPIQESFSGLLELNPETIGYLTVGEDISLPVVQRQYDNDFYLNHNFEGEESNAGTLFLDGANLLAPEDMSLIVYGHNMKNGTMFHKLLEYENYAYLSQNPLVYFDTIYKNRAYVPFAVFSASMDEDSKNYIDIRQFAFDEVSFNYFVERMETISLWDIPVDVKYGDSILLLVTCEYTYDNGRFVLALRAVRENETQKQMINLVRSAREN